MKHISSPEEPLPHEEQRELARRFQDECDREAADRLIRTNMRYILKLARDFENDDTSMDDLIQAGCLGLQRALHKYDPDNDTPFLHYASYWIRAKMNDQVNFDQSPMKFTTNDGRKIYQNLGQVIRDTDDVDDRSSYQRVAEALDVGEEEVHKVMKGVNVSSLEETVSHDHDTSDRDLNTYRDLLEDDRYMLDQDRQVIARELQDLVDEFGATLDERNADIWDNRIATDEPEDLKSIADRWDVSSAWICQLRDRLQDRFLEWLEDRYDMSF